MTEQDVLALEPGDSIIGFNDTWADELPVASTGPVRHARGVIRRRVAVLEGRQLIHGWVRAGDATIRGARRCTP